MNVRSNLRTDAQRVELLCNVVGQSLGTDGQHAVGHLTCSLANGLGRVSTLCESLSVAFHLLLQIFLINIACSNVDVDVLDVACLLVGTEQLFQLFVLSLEFAIFNLHVVVLDASEGKSCHVDVTLVCAAIEAGLRSNGVADHQAIEQSLILVVQSLTANCLLNELPVVVHLLVLLLDLAANLRVGHDVVVLIQELLESIHIKSSLLSTEGSLCK